ncbi:MAG TPA: hypothetical protein VK591_08010 [Xanthobacteraceae bacterium]|nr:hypothetical protein [Xanthobacteraceae bacterium]
MLPRIASLDREFSEAIQNYVRARARGTQLLSEIKAHMIHEGRDSAIRRSTNELEHARIQESIVETTMSFEEIDDVDLDYVIKKANEIAAKFEEQMSRHLFQTMDEATQKTGLRADAGGKPLTNDLLIEMLSKMHMDFEKSQAGDMSIVASPQMMPVFERLGREMEENPAMKRRWDSMIEEKRNEFREREINRNLVG